MADVRVTRGVRSRIPGIPVGIQVNTFGLDALLEGLTGNDLEPLVHDALIPAYDQVHGEWPIDTGASLDSLRIETDEVGARHVRVSLRIGGAQLIEDARNVKHIDYAPFIEFNGSPGGSPPGIILYAMTSQARLIRNLIHANVRDLVERRLRA